ncbi:GGDEF domain-containing protein [Shewanella olleyana]|uniref:GGDEF domain-containing protein n=1 Tax=Shewanella olleyana TaxID=135626 RepID=UPI00200E1DD5|nr:GGDEF domain-containing protein [Shewanella olleyana]MCL1066310.1 GGDEF domain-containing protein [Shewanella olleyana]
MQSIKPFDKSILKKYIWKNLYFSLIVTFVFATIIFILGIFNENERHIQLRTTLLNNANLVLGNFILESEIIEYAIKNGSKNNELTIDTLKDISNKFSINEIENNKIYLDIFNRTSKNEFTRYSLTRPRVISKINDNSHCWNDEKCLENNFNIKDLNNKIFLEEIDKTAYSYYKPIFVDNKLYGKITSIHTLPDTFANAYTIDISQVIKGKNVTQTVRLKSKKALFDDKLSKVTSQMSSEGLNLVLYSPLTYPIRENAPTVILVFIMTFVLRLMLRNSQELKAKNGLLSMENYKDSLTSSYNRKLLESDYFLQRNQNHRLNGGVISIILIDGNRIKTINDTYGHSIGDLAIQYIDQAIHESIRESDDSIRLGGDEFLIIARCKEADATSLINRIIVNLQTRVIPSTNINVDISFGCTEYSAEESFDVAISRADKLMYQNKNSIDVADEN